MIENLVGDSGFGTLDDAERRVFVHAIGGLISVDNTFTDYEIELFKKIGTAVGFAPYEVVNFLREPFPPEETLRRIGAITDRRKALLLLREMCVAANIDDNLAEREVDFIMAAAERLGVSLPKSIEINELVIKQIALAAAEDDVLERTGVAESEREVFPAPSAELFQPVSAPPAAAEPTAVREKLKERLARLRGTG